MANALSHIIASPSEVTNSNCGQITVNYASAQTNPMAIGPLRIDVTVTAKWPLWVLRNVTPFTPSHFRQSSEQMFLVLVFVSFKTVFLEFVSNAS